MTPSQVRCLAFFYDYRIEDDTERKFINRLCHKQVSYRLTEIEQISLSDIFNKYAPDRKDDMGILKDMLDTVKKIEYCRIYFVDTEGNPVLNSYQRPIELEF